MNAPLLLPRADKLYLTRVKGSHEGNVYFPKINFDEFKLISSNEQDNLTFEVYERIKKLYQQKLNKETKK